MMKKQQPSLIHALLIGVILAPTSCHAVPAAIAGPISVAVFDFKSGDQLAPDAGSTLAVLVNSFLSNEENLILVERAELEKILGEQELGLSGTVAPTTAAKLNQLTGAKVLVTGRVFTEGDQCVAVAKVMGVETSRVYGEMSRQKDSNALGGLAEDLAKKIARRISENADTLMAKAVSKDERIDKLIKSLPEGKRPVVAVHIPERHFGAQVIDPAATMEFLMILNKAGFAIVDEKSNKRPDIEIKGEAFSAFAMRKGNLVSCKARIEITVRDSTNDKLLMVDRQTSVSVDITEHTAAKTALELGVLDLAERVLPKLL